MEIFKFAFKKKQRFSHVNFLTPFSTNISLPLKITGVKSKNGNSLTFIFCFFSVL